MYVLKALGFGAFGSGGGTYSPPTSCRRMNAYASRASGSFTRPPARFTRADQIR
jgi:hypothetical protein